MRPQSPEEHSRLPVSSPGGEERPADTPRRLRLGSIEIDRIGFDEAIARIDQLITSGRGGVVLTPNVDHVVIAERDQEFVAAYARADLSLADGQPIVWSSRLLGAPVPERVAGADLVPLLMARAAKRRWRVFLLGAGPGVAAEASTILRMSHGVDVVGTAAPLVTVDPDGTDPEGDAAVEAICAARPHLVLVAFGAPKQEIWIHRHRRVLEPAVLIGVGASLEFVAGRIRRAPRWISRVGLEWLWRLGHEPRRLWRRYLVQDLAFFRLLAREIWRRWRADG